MFGPGADAKLGAREPDLDNWEAGRSEPSVAQLAKLGRMANVPVTFFYLPDDAQPELSVARVCMRGRSRLIVSMCADVLDSAPQPTLFEDLR